ncbi:spore germination protein [Oceanobacillus halotolerans]|uniref:spore germination protein n=1 Tax=Oceanobacillus halotolerans TaxID=2663380 RepID=UPI0013DC2CE4|nr:spore germination protein [Oceanobacillus halotolerans]
MVSHINNVYGIRVNNISNNASINFGHVLHKGHQANIKMNVGYQHNGDANQSPMQFNNANHVNDPDALDQTQQQV